MDELKADTEYVINLLKCDTQFEGLISKMTHQEAMVAVVEAFDSLCSSPETQQVKPKYLTPKGCLVVFLVQQLLVRLFTKRLMQLMTTEAIILYKDKIPHSYLENYLHCQAHFSLKNVISKYHTILKKNV